MKVYVLCPVRNCTEEERVLLDSHVRQLEAEGHLVHYPPRDVDQADDGCGMAICQAHAKALEQADRIDVLWNSASTGSHFDFGMAFFRHQRRPLRFRLIGAAPMPTPHKSYVNVLLRLVELR